MESFVVVLDSSTIVRNGVFGLLQFIFLLVVCSLKMFLQSCVGCEFMFTFSFLWADERANVFSWFLFYFVAKKWNVRLWGPDHCVVVVVGFRCCRWFCWHGFLFGWLWLFLSANCNEQKLWPRSHYIYSSKQLPIELSLVVLVEWLNCIGVDTSFPSGDCW